MTETVCMYFHVHQPRRLRKLPALSNRPEGPLTESYFDEGMNKHYFEKAARQCYFPANNAVLKGIKETDGNFRVSYSLSGVMLEQAKRYDSKVIDSFSKLYDTGSVELVNETHYHSLACLYADKTEFREQVKEHATLLWDLFGARPTAFRNTELLYRNDLAAEVESMGYQVMLGEGIEWVLGWRSANYAYKPKGAKNMSLLLRNYKLSDDVGYRFGARWWPEWPLTAEKYAHWLGLGEGQTTNLFMDYETFGEHHWQDTGILKFLERLPHEVLNRQMKFRTVTETAKHHPPVGELDIPNLVSWADLERDASAWLGNPMQKRLFAELEELAPKVATIGDVEMSKAYKYLTTSDHLYYLCTKSLADGDVHLYFSPYKDQNPYENFIDYAAVISDFRKEVERRLADRMRTLELAKHLNPKGERHDGTDGESNAPQRIPGISPHTHGDALNLSNHPAATNPTWYDEPHLHSRTPPTPSLRLNPASL